MAAIIVEDLDRSNVTDHSKRERDKTCVKNKKNRRKQQETRKKVEISLGRTRLI
jgi:hypothetical protein